MVEIRKRLVDRIEALERQLAEARAERDTLAIHLEAKAILAKRDNAQLREALSGACGAGRGMRNDDWFLCRDANCEGVWSQTPRILIAQAIKEHAGLSDWDAESVDSEVDAILAKLDEKGWSIVKRI